VLHGENELATVARAAVRAGLRPTSCVAAAALASAQGAEPPTWHSEPRELLTELMRTRAAVRPYGTNLNQIAAALNSGVTEPPVWLVAAVAGADRASCWWRRPRAAGCWRWRRRGSNDGSSDGRSPVWPEEADMNEHSGQGWEQELSGDGEVDDGQQWAALLEPAGGSNQLLLTVPEAAAVLRMSRAKLYELMRRGQVLSVLIGGSRRVPRTAVLAYVRELTEVAERQQVERRQADRRGSAVDWRSSWSAFGLDRPA